MLILGIESSCDETAASVTDGPQRVLSSVVHAQHDLHAEYGGVVPEIASRAHAERILPTVRAAVDRAGIRLADLDAVSVGHRPGLIGSLLVGLSAAKSLAWSLGIPLVGVDHVHAHLHAPALARGDSIPDPIAFPALGLVVSGGHTTMYRLDGPTELERLGGTIDDAVGEAFDKAASILDLGHPGGPAIDRLAQDPDADDRAHDFPVSRLGPDSLDFSFSGLKTAMLYAAKGRPQPRKIPGKPEVRVEPAPELTPERVRDLAASFQRAAVRALTVKLGRALETLGERGDRVESLVVGGGVSANSRVRSELEAFTTEHGLALRVPPMDYCVDNGAMIAGLGAVLLERGETSDLSLEAVPTTAC
ncbi:MAG: tRNA (adenosine(37)-N6)-threonylcarbamoyltransferase complex transferase subunit TsaD [Phycisphaerales bacterium JB040]